MNLRSDDFYEIAHRSDGWGTGYYLIDVRTDVQLERRYRYEVDAKIAKTKLFNAEMKRIEKLITS